MNGSIQPIPFSHKITFRWDNKSEESREYEFVEYKQPK